MTTTLITDKAPITSIPDACRRLGLAPSFAARQCGITLAFFEKIVTALEEGKNPPCSTRTKYTIECELHMEPGCLTGDPAYMPMVRPLHRSSAYRDRETPNYAAMLGQIGLASRAGMASQTINPRDYDNWRTGGAAYL